MGLERPMTSAERVANRRAALRAQGLRPRTFWLPDTSTSAFQERARRDCAWLWDRVPEDGQLMAFAEAMTDDLLADIDEEQSARAQQQDRTV